MLDETPKMPPASTAQVIILTYRLGLGTDFSLQLLGPSAASLSRTSVTLCAIDT